MMTFFYVPLRSVFEENIITMKKLLCIVIVALFGLSIAFAQDVKEVKVTLNKQEVTAFSANVAKIDAGTLVEAMKDYFREQGFSKPKNVDKYVYYKNQKCEDLGSVSYDIYMNASESGKKDALVGTLYVVFSLGNENIVSTEAHPAEAATAQTFMAKVPKIVERYQLKLEIEKMQKDIEDANKEAEKNQKALEKIQKAIEEHNSKLQDKTNKLGEAQELLKNFAF